MGERTFDDSGLVDELRCHTREWLETARVEAVREQRRWRVRELAITCALDERGRIDDAAWARRAKHTSPEDLHRSARRKRIPTPEDGRKRRQARNLGFWWRKDDAGMLDGRFSLPDVDGALFERVVNQMIDQMKPAKGQPWQTRARRGADALMDLVRNHAHVEAPSGPDPYFVVHIPADGPAEVAGIPLPEEMVESLRASAKLEPVLVDDAGVPITRGRTRAALPPKVVRGVRWRDAKCRWPGCERRTGLQVHHLWPVSWGGGDEQSNLALVCVGGGTDHHGLLAPHGRYLLLGNPSLPDGLHLIHVDQLAALAELAVDQARTKSEAA